ncbi:MAG: response regulator [Vicinamibacterales bacterium]
MAGSREASIRDVLGWSTREPDVRASFDGSGSILIADDEPTNIRLVTRLMSAQGYKIFTAADGEQALTVVERERPDLILLDVNMPKLDGFEVCRRVKGEEATRLIPVVLVTGLTASEDRIRGINAGADDFISKPFNIQELEARVKSLTRLKHYTDELDSAEAVFLSLGMTIEARDPYTRGHCQRLAHYAAALGVRLGLDDDQLLSLYRGAFLHDVGKIGIPDAVLLKPAGLTADEYSVMQTHTVIGDGLCSELRSLEDVRPIVRHHHERLDGTGYPDRLGGHAIPLLALILGVVDLYDALTTDRPYRGANSPTEAFQVLRDEVEKGWKSAEVVEEFIGLAHENDFNRLTEAAATSSPRFHRFRRMH